MIKHLVIENRWCSKDLCQKYNKKAYKQESEWFCFLNFFGVTFLQINQLSTIENKGKFTRIWKPHYIPLKSSFLIGEKPVRGLFPVLFFPFGDIMWSFNSCGYQSSFAALRPTIWGVTPSTRARSAPAPGPCGMGSRGLSPFEKLFGVGSSTPNLPISAVWKK